MIEVTVAYALPQQQHLLVVVLPAESRVEEAIQRSGIVQRCPEIDLLVNGVGIAGRAVTLQHRLQQGDRVEIYRPLLADPKEIRRRRAAEQKGVRGR
ncbi:MAG: RnfH family protein [Enterobacteriaceae bacterium]